MDNVAALFAGWNETLIWSCLQGHMGKILVNDMSAPTAAIAEIGDFCFLAGQADRALLDRTSAPIAVPGNSGWERLIVERFGDRAEKTRRYAIKKDCVFDPERLRKLTFLPDEYGLRPFDGELYRMTEGSEWSRDFCSNFAGEEDFLRRGTGVGVMHRGRLVSGASSYSVYDGGIEIEIDTMPGYRRRGLAAACGAALILRCLDMGLYPSWDAHDLRSVRLAEKLGYTMDRPYTVYIIK